MKIRSHPLVLAVSMIPSWGMIGGDALDDAGHVGSLGGLLDEPQVLRGASLAVLLILLRGVGDQNGSRVNV